MHYQYDGSAIIFFKQINALSIAPPLCRHIRFIGSIHLLCIAYIPEHTLLTTLLAGSVHPLCTAYLAGGVGVMYVDTQHCEIDYSLFYVIFYIRKKQTNKLTSQINSIIYRDRLRPVVYYFFIRSSSSFFPLSYEKLKCYFYCDFLSFLK